MVSEIATLMCCEATHDLPLEEVEIKTPITTAKFKTIAGKKLAIVPRSARLTWVCGRHPDRLFLPPRWAISACAGPDTLEPVEYYCKMPNDIAEQGRSSFWTPCWQPAALPLRPSSLSKIMRPCNIKLMNIIAALPRHSAVHHDHPDVDIYCAALWTRSSTTMATSSPAWATPVTVSSAPSKNHKHAARASARAFQSRGPPHQAAPLSACLCLLAVLLLKVLVHGLGGPSYGAPMARMTVAAPVTASPPA